MRSKAAVFRAFRAPRSLSGTIRTVRGGTDSRLLSGALLLGLLLVPTTGVEAQTTIYAPGDGAPNSAALAIDVKASVGGRCGFTTGSAPSAAISKPDFDSLGFTEQVPFRLNCTAASRVAVVSANGALLTGQASDVMDPGYANQAPYDVKLTLVPNTGSPVVATCAAATLKASAAATCSNNFRGPAGPATGLKLSGPSTTPTSILEVSAPPYAGANTLVAGTYSDTLVVTVSPSS